MSRLAAALPPLEAVFAEALDHHRAGRLPQAEAAYRRVLARDGRHAECLHMLGLLARQTGQSATAAALIGQAIAVDPQVGAYHCHLGNVWAAMGRLEKAAASFRRAVALQPRDVEAHYNLGTVLLAQGEPAAAAECFRRALELDPALAGAHNNLGNALRALGEAQAAAASYRRALALAPGVAEAHANLGDALRECGALAEAEAAGRQAVALAPDSAATWLSLGATLRLLLQPEEAAACFRQVLTLRPDDRLARRGLASVLHDQGLLEAASASYRLALAASPDDADLLLDYARALHGLGRLDEAVAHLRRAQALRPESPDICHVLGLALQAQGQPAAAAAVARRAIELHPQAPEPHRSLGRALRDMGEPEAALACLQRAVALAPEDPEARIDLGNALLDLGQDAAAIGCYRHALQLRPADPLALNNLGVALSQQQQLDAAAACFRQAIAIAPQQADSHLFLAMTLLARGEFDEGWREFEWRRRLVDAMRARPPLAQPQWRGEPAAGRTLLVHAEQGFGDTLQFCRYAALAAARGLRVILEVPAPLQRLLRGLEGADQVLAAGEALPPFDLHCPMMSLPLALGTTLESIPAAPSYLRANAQAAAAWRQRLAGPGRRVGLAWAGNSQRDSLALRLVARRRSVDPALLEPLFARPGVRWFSLQKDGPAAPEHLPLTDVMGEMTDFADTAALIANLDLVISVDTAVAHLAAALGRPVWLLNRFDSCWRWLQGREDSPWYPGLRIFRQPRAGDWASVVAAVRLSL